MTTPTPTLTPEELEALKRRLAQRGRVTQRPVAGSQGITQPRPVASPLPLTPTPVPVRPLPPAPHIEDQRGLAQRNLPLKHGALAALEAISYRNLLKNLPIPGRGRGPEILASTIEAPAALADVAFGPIRPEAKLRQLSAESRQALAALPQQGLSETSRALAENFAQRPFIQQLGLGVLFDPFIAGAAARTAVRMASRLRPPPVTALARTRPPVTTGPIRPGTLPATGRAVAPLAAPPPRALPEAGPLARGFKPPARIPGVTKAKPIVFPGRRGLEPQLPTAERIVRETQVAQARAAGRAPVPARQLGEPIGRTMDTPAPRETFEALTDDLNIPTHEVPQAGLMRRFEGARNLAAAEMQSWYNQGTRLLKGSGVTAERAQMEPLFKALHDEVTPQALPATLRPIYDDIRLLVKQETAEMVDFLSQAQTEEFSVMFGLDKKNFAGRLMAHPDYFPRGWSQTKTPSAALPKGSVGVRPGFTIGRVDATFSELLATGREPVSWNPYTMMALRRISGIEYREAIRFINALKQRELALPLSEAPATWRVPKNVGPVFEGRPIPVKGGDIAFTKQLAVPPRVANFVEDLLGRSFKSTSEKDILDRIQSVGEAAKRLKLFASLFQHIDIGARATFAATTPTGIVRAAPLKIPSLYSRMARLQFSPKAREKLLQRLVSDEEVVKGSDVTYKMLVSEGWGIQGDLSLIRRQAVNVIDSEIAKGLTGKSLQNARKAREFFEGGLFDGFYREGARFSLENFIVPAIKRANPQWTARQVAAKAAEDANIMFSTLGRWQTSWQSPGFRKLARSILFSTNEQEALIRQALGAVKGADKGFWNEWFVGVFLGLAGIGSIINLASTGKPLPVEAYSPFKFNDPYAPFRVGYSGRFMSPQAPGITARDGGPVYVDTVGQMDTAFRWVLDPVGALSARYNVVPRAILNQVKGETFFGEQVKGLGPKALQLVSDLAAPIPVQQALGALSERIPVIPEQEGRLGVGPQLIQGFPGINLRAESTGELLDRTAGEVFPGKKYDDLEPYQKSLLREFSTATEELARRQKTGAERKRPISQFFSRREAIDKELESRLVDAVNTAETKFGLYNAYRSARDKASGRYKQLGIDIEFEDFERPGVDDPDPNKAALAQYYAILDKYRDVKGDVNWRDDGDKITAEQRTLLKTLPSPVTDYVVRNINRGPMPRAILRSFPKSLRHLRFSILASQDAREEHLKVEGKPDLAEQSKKAFYLLGRVERQAAPRR